MSCPKTRILLSEYFDEKLDGAVRQEIERHIQNCEYCSQELAELKGAEGLLGHWHEQQVPHWDRGSALFRRQHLADNPGRSRLWLQWIPVAASVAMLAVMLLNVSVAGDGAGFSLRFGLPASDNNAVADQLAGAIVRQQNEQDAALQRFATQIDQQLASNNQRTIQAVIELTRELNADNFERVLSYIEQQRELDMDSIRASYQQLLDRDFETLLTMEQLAGYLQTQRQF